MKNKKRSRRLVKVHSNITRGQERDEKERAAEYSSSALKSLLCFGSVCVYVYVCVCVNVRERERWGKRK